MCKSNISVIVIGGSAGSFDIITKLLQRLPSIIPIPIVIVVHRQREDDSNLADVFAEHYGRSNFCESMSNQAIEKNHIYFAPANYHLLFESTQAMSLTVDPLVNYSRPSIDLAFESAASNIGKSAVAILLSGANRDGTKGCKAVKDAGGIVIVQDPSNALFRCMPQSAIDSIPNIDHVLSENKIIDLLLMMESNEAVREIPC